jgi:hypothetical protein
MLMTQAAATPPVDGVATPPKPKMVCRTYEETGSLVKKQRICRTASAWMKNEEQQRAEADRLNQHISAQRGN